ncbi:unknown [Spodoptera litura nucleopolyhedrovirus II]|uniref:hypothetical protein n=1 Tax=Spodoptera litura nucleopolyhedrovirus II TaxID=566270 RepID=UPI0001874647|nr:hypothetical protein SlnV2_gp009 [Spodoptera litura nucleopolyhedrovirus II]ACI47378.1 unknown [Spodoptera litura nucleopolyhedrovirus II]
MHICTLETMAYGKIFGAVLDYAAFYFNKKQRRDFEYFDVVAEFTKELRQKFNNFLPKRFIDSLIWHAIPICEIYHDGDIAVKMSSCSQCGHGFDRAYDYQDYYYYLPELYCSECMTPRFVVINT